MRAGCDITICECEQINFVTACFLYVITRLLVVMVLCFRRGFCAELYALLASLSYGLTNF